MNNRSSEILNKELHPHAEEVATHYVDEYSTSLLLQAKLLAFRENADLVLSNHVEAARERMQREGRKPFTLELFIVIGGALFGAFVPGFVSELNSGHKLLLVIYTFM
jgi:hypothetical protein